MRASKRAQIKARLTPLAGGDQRARVPPRGAADEGNGSWARVGDTVTLDSWVGSRTAGAVGDGEVREPLTDVGAFRPGEVGGRPGVRAHERFVGRASRPDEYRLVARVARGGEGFVWRAEYQGSLPRSVGFAIKQFVAPRGFAQAEWPPRELIDRWFAQLRLLQLVRDDHVVGYREIFVGWPPHVAAGDTGTYFAEPSAELRTWYLVMEWVDGPTLHELVSDGQLSLLARVDVIVEIAAAVDLLHSGA